MKFGQNKSSLCLGECKGTSLISIMDAQRCSECVCVCECVSVCVCVCYSLTPLQRVLCDRLAVDSQAGCRVGCHLDLVLSPDDELLQQAVVHLRTADVLHLELT